MPYPSEHAARLADPGKFEQGSFRRTNDKFGKRIHAIFGKIDGQEELTLQAVRFSKQKFTAEEAKEWLRSNKMKPILFEPAMEEKDSEMREVPRNALQFNMGEFALSEENGEGAKSAPLKMTIRSGQPINHWYWGKVVHDRQGMRLGKSRVAVDYNHNADEVIGYLNHFNVDGADIECKGALCPFKESDRATEVIFKARQGVPYEASINFAGDSYIEEVREGAVAEVNGYKLEGPATIFREWTLRGVAVCPYGADANTATELSTQDRMAVQVFKTGNDEKELDMGENAEADKPAVEAPKNEELEAEGTQPVEAPGKKFLAAFGEKGGVWFAEGLSFEQAQEKFNVGLVEANKALSAEVDELKKQLAAKPAQATGEAAPAKASAPAPESKAAFIDRVRDRMKAGKMSFRQAMSELATEDPEGYKEHRKSGTR